jgi:peptidoglycan hydrolase-like protein with peptidoglycan-binding domain
VARSLNNTSTLLKVGSRGEEVRTLQQNLTKLGYDTKGTDGIFGNAQKIWLI